MDFLGLDTEGFLLLLGQGLDVGHIRLFLPDRAVFSGAAFQHRVFVVFVGQPLQQAQVGRGQLDVGMGKVVIREDDAAFADETVGFQHAGKCLCQDGFARSALTDDRDGFMFIDIQADVPDRGQDPAAYIEFDADVFQGKEDFPVFILAHDPPSLHMRPGIRGIRQVLAQNVQNYGDG